MKKLKTIILLIVLLTIPVSIYAFAPATHMYLGMQTPEVWRDYDDTFANYLNNGDFTNAITLKITKFYYLGLTLPDMFDQQDAIREVVNNLYDNRNYIDDASSLEIKVETKNGVNSDITFNGALPNHNIEKLREMAEYAKSQEWSALEKSLIYGAYMHAIHDSYANSVFQPSLFGYGKVYDKSGNNVMSHPENYYELFTWIC